MTIADFSGSVPGVQVTTKPSAFSALSRAAALAVAGAYSAETDSAFALADAAAAHARCERGGLRGKVVLEIPG